MSRTMATTIPSNTLLATSPGVRARKFADAMATVVLWVMASSIILLLGLFIVYMFYLGARYLTPSFIFGMPAETTAGANKKKSAARARFTAQAPAAVRRRGSRRLRRSTL